MFCSECGKTIDDEALICPECGTITKKGIITLQDAAKQGASVSDNQVFSLAKSKDNSKTLRLVAMILGFAGSAALVLSLLAKFFSITVPIFGETSTSISGYLGKLMVLVFVFAGLGAAFSFFRLAVPQIITGAFTGFLGIFMCLDIKQRASGVSDYLSVNFGIGIYLFFASAALILASGIMYIVAVIKNKQSGIVDEKASNRKKTELIVSICLGVLVACGIVIVMISNNQGKTEAKNTVAQFMDSAIHYEVNFMKSYLATDVNDKNGFMEAYDPEIMSKSLHAGLNVSVSYDYLKDEFKQAIDETAILFGKHYLKKYDIGKVKKNADGSFEVKVSASIINMKSTSDQIQNKAAEKVTEFIEDNPSTIRMLRDYYYSDEDLARFLAYYLYKDMCSIVNDAIKGSAEMETEFTFVVKNIGGTYKITEIDYKDE